MDTMENARNNFNALNRKICTVSEILFISSIPEIITVVIMKVFKR